MEGNIDNNSWDDILNDPEDVTLEGEEGAAAGAAGEGAGTEASGGDPGEAEGGSGAEGGAGSEAPPVEGSFSPEMQAAINAETQKAINAFIEKEFAGVTNPYTKQPIKTQADLDAYRQAFAAERRQQQLQEMGVDPKQLEQIVNGMPQVQQAQQIIQQQQMQAANDFAAKEFAALKKEYPDCGLNAPEELWDTETGRKALDLWSKGVSMVDAYAATHRAEIKQRQTAAVRQAAMNEMNSKSHLKPTKGGSAGGAVEVPDDVKATMREWFGSSLSDAEIAEMYRKNHMNDK